MSTRIKAFHGDTIPMALSGLVGFDGVPVTNLTGWALIFTVKASKTDAAALLQKSTTAGTITIAGGEAFWEISGPENSALFSPGETYFCDVQAEDALLRIGTAITSTITISKDITT